MAGAANVLIKIGANAGQAVGEIGKVNKALGDQMTASEKASNTIRKAAVPAGIALAALGAAAVSAAKAAAEDQEAQVKLAGVLERTTGATTDAIAATEDYIGKLSLSTGVADDQLRPAMAKLATATGDVSKAQEGLGIALDISAATGKSVDTVSVALSKAYAGNTSALKKLIPGISEAALESGNFADINAELARLTGGAAAEAAGTAAGQYRIFQLTLQETQEEIGMALLPILEKLAPRLVELATFVKNNTDLIVKLGAAIAGAAAIIVGLNAAITAYKAVQTAAQIATVAWTVAQYALNVALTANPIGIVVVAIAALVAALVIAYNRSETFRKIVDTLFAAIKEFTQAALKPFIENWDTIGPKVEAVVSILRRFWPLLLPGGALYMALKEAEDRWGAVSGAVDAARAYFVAIKTIIETVVTIIRTLIEVITTLARTINSIVDGALSRFESAFDRIRSIVNDIIRLLPSIRIPSIPGFGGRRLSSTDALTVEPANQTIVNVTINGPIDADSTAREIVRILNQYDTRYVLA